MPTETHESCWSRECLLAHCEGFRVVASGRQIGFVESILVSEEGDPEALAVRTGAGRASVVPIQFTDVGEVDGVNDVVIVPREAVSHAERRPPLVASS